MCKMHTWIFKNVVNSRNSQLLPQINACLQPIIVTFQQIPMCHHYHRPGICIPSWKLVSTLQISTKLKSICFFITWKWGLEHIFENRRMHPIQEMLIWRKWLPLKDMKGNLNSLRRLSRGVWSPSRGVRYILCTESALTTKMTKLTDLLLLSLWWPCLPLFSTACFTLSLSQSLQEAISARQSYITCT